MSTHNIQSLCRRKDYPKLSLFASWTGAMINPRWLELPVSRTNFHGPKDVPATEVRLYLDTFNIYHTCPKIWTCPFSYLLMPLKIAGRVAKTIDLNNQGPVVQSIVSLTSLLRVISLTVLAASIYNILIFFAEKNVSSSHFFSKKFQHICVSLNANFNENH